MTRTAGAALALALSLPVTAPLLAHHSFAAHYDMQKPISVQGTLLSVRLSNPHSWFYVEAKDAEGKAVRWAFEAGTPSGMIRNGYKASELPPGTVVTITGFHARDEAQNVGMMRQLTRADGKTYGMFGPQEGAAGR